MILFDFGQKIIALSAKVCGRTINVAKLLLFFQYVILEINIAYASQYLLTKTFIQVPILLAFQFALFLVLYFLDIFA